MEETGKVVAVIGDVARIEIARGSGCGGCKACAASSDGNMMIAEVLNSLHAKVGDRVVLTIPDNTITNLALLTYGLPTVAFLMGFFLFRYVPFVVRLCGSADLASVLGVVLFTAAAFVLVRLATVHRSRAASSQGSGAPIEFLRIAAILPAKGESQKACISEEE